MRRTTRRILAIAAAAAVLFTLLLLPGMALAAAGDVTVTGNGSLDIEADGTKGSTTLSASCANAATHGTTPTFTYSITAGADAVDLSGSTVTAKAAGAATITATCSEDPADTGTISITVTQKTANTSVSITGAGNLDVGGTFTATAAPSPNVAGTYTWSCGSGATLLSANGTNTMQVRADSAASSYVKVTFTPTNPNYLPSDRTETFTITDNQPTLTVSVNHSTLTDVGASGTAKATAVNYTPTSYEWRISGNSVRFLGGGTSTTTQVNEVLYYAETVEGSSTITCTVSGGTGTAPAPQSATVNVNLPDPYLSVWLEHDTLTWLRPKTTAHAELHYPDGTVTNSSRIYWSSNNTKIASVSGVYDHLEHGKATAIVRAKGNGTTRITAYTSHQRVYDSASVLVTGYKHLPQSGQDTRLLYAEGAALILLLAAAGVVYARRRKNSQGQ